MWPLTFVINLSLTQGKFSDPLKTVKFIPIHKSDNKLSITNYRPISILTFFSKIFERLMYHRLLDYLNKNDILCHNQYCFRENHSTYMALLNMIDDISNKLNNNNDWKEVFIDLSKAFDTIDHSLLLKKLEHYGIRGTALSWFTSYLTKRSQYVSTSGNNSSCLQIKCGVPQGSILGLLLFIVYINDIINCSKAAIFIMFADDTNLFFKHNNLKTLYEHVNIELQKNISLVYAK